MAQTYLKKIELASKAEYRNGRKIRLMILIITIAAALFEASDFTVSNNDEYGAVTKYSPNFDGFFGLFLMFVAAAFGALWYSEFSVILPTSRPRMFSSHCP